MSTAGDDALIGRKVGRYTVQAVLRSGPFGTVYRVWDPEHQVERALEVLHQVHEVFEEDGLLCVVTELAPSGGLAQPAPEPATAQVAAPSPPPPPGRPAPPPRAAVVSGSRRRRRRRNVVVGVVAAALVLAGAGAALAHAVAPRPDTRPAGATDARILSVVQRQLGFAGCASSQQPATPVTCPNMGDFHDDYAAIWEPAGDPTAGATVRYAGQGQFAVRGRLVAVLKGDDFAVGAGSSTTTFFPQVDDTPYEAFVSWDGGQPRVTRIDRTPVGPPAPRPPGASDQKAIEAETDSFNQCATSGLAAGDAGCPSAGVQPCGHSTPSGQLNWDQAGVPRVTDTPEGIVHVTGTYSLDETLTSTTPMCPPTQTARVSGTYDLWMVWDGQSAFQVVRAVYRPQQPAGTGS